MSTGGSEVEIHKRSLKRNATDQKAPLKMNNAFYQLIGRGRKRKEQV